MHLVQTDEVKARIALGADVSQVEAALALTRGLVEEAYWDDLRHVVGGKQLSYLLLMQDDCPEEFAVKVLDPTSHYHSVLGCALVALHPKFGRLSFLAAESYCGAELRMHQPKFTEQVKYNAFWTEAGQKAFMELCNRPFTTRSEHGHRTLAVNIKCHAYVRDLPDRLGERVWEEGVDLFWEEFKGTRKADSHGYWCDNLQSKALASCAKLWSIESQGRSGGWAVFRYGEGRGAEDVEDFGTWERFEEFLKEQGEESHDWADCEVIRELMKLGGEGCWLEAANIDLVDWDELGRRIPGARTIHWILCHGTGFDSLLTDADVAAQMARDMERSVEGGQSWLEEAAVYRVEEAISNTKWEQVLEDFPTMDAAERVVLGEWLVKAGDDPKERPIDDGFVHPERTVAFLQEVKVTKDNVAAVAQALTMLEMPRHLTAVELSW